MPALDRPVRRSLLRLATAVALAVASLGGLAAPPAADASLPRWTGGIDLYRAGVFTTQKTWLWCTAADVQIIRNIVDHERDHASASQRRYFDYMRAHDRYAIPVSDGTDPAGWTAGLRHFVDARYRLVVSSTFSAALRSAVTDLRLTNRPVGLLVAHGDHAWVLTGFTATADPARTSHFTVTSVRVTGPLYGLQDSRYGYDMPPDTRLTASQLAHFLTPWHYARIRMAWEGRYLTISAAPGGSPPAPVQATATSRPAATLRASPPSSATPSATPSPVPASVAASPSRPTVALAAPVARPTDSGIDGAHPDPAPEPAALAAAGSALPLALAVATSAVALLLGASLAARRSPRPRPGRRHSA